MRLLSNISDCKLFIRTVCMIPRIGEVFFDYWVGSSVWLILVVGSLGTGWLSLSTNGLRVHKRELGRTSYRQLPNSSVKCSELPVTRRTRKFVEIMPQSKWKNYDGSHPQSMFFLSQKRCGLCGPLLNLAFAIIIAGGYQGKKFYTFISNFLRVLL